MKIYNKLVRDKIPQIIIADGKKCTTRTLNDTDYLHELDRKLSEEVSEYLSSGEVEEIADIQEVLSAIILARGYTEEQLQAVRSRKREERGGFDSKVFLLTVSDNN